MKHPALLKNALPWRLFWLAALGPLLGLLGRWHWFFDIFSHFRVQEVVILLLFIPFLVWMKQWKKALIAAAVCLAFSFSLLEYLPLSKSAEARPGPSLTITYANIGRTNPHYQQLINVLKEGEAPILVISEITAEWQQTLDEVLRRYPYREVALRRDNFGIAVYSKIPFVSSSVQYVGTVGVPSIHCVFKRQGKEVVLWATHPIPPIGGEHWRLRNEQLIQMGNILAAEPRPQILVGDLNTTPWCYWWKVIKGKGFKDTAVGKGVFPTWPSYWPAFLRVPIDHVFVTDPIPVLERRTLGKTGSDHFPIQVTLGI